MMMGNGGNIVKKIRWKYVYWSFWICIILPFIVPSTFHQDGKGHFAFGLPMNYVTIYQDHPNSAWLFDNLFSGNSGMAIHIGEWILNIIIVYFLILFLAKIISKKSPSELSHS